LIHQAGDTGGTVRKRLLGIYALAVGAGLAGLFWSPSAQAAILGPENTTTPIPLTRTDWTSSLAFPQFDPSLGTLLSVELDLSGSLQTTITITNTSLSPSSGTASTNSQMTVQDGGSNLVAPELNLLSPGYGYSLGGGDSVTSGLLTASGTSSNLYTLPAVLTEFTGVGSFVLPASTFTQTFLANTGGNTNASQVTSDSLTGSVTYTYSVPEPASLSLFVVALPFLAARRRRTA
jgi:hypothetical protein